MRYNKKTHRAKNLSQGVKPAPSEKNTGVESLERETMKLYSFNAPESLMNDLKKLSIENMVPMSAMIRASILEYIKRNKE